MTVELLPRHPHLPLLTAPLVFVVMDGVGCGAKDGGDAVWLAQTPHLDRLWRDAPTRTLRAHGTAVGMPSDADMGNSEVGHNALGAGRIFRQGAALVQDALASGRLFEGATWHWLTGPLHAKLAPPGATLHLCGLLSDGNVHAHYDHVLALLHGADRANVQRVRIHALADGRDVSDPSFELYVAQLQQALAVFALAGRDYRIASGGGRMAITMDRYEADWAMVERGWRCHVHGEGLAFPSVDAALARLRDLPGGQSDQTLGPFVIAEDGHPIGRVRDGDSFAFWNFRGDRAIELTRAFEDGEPFAAFDRGHVPQVRFAGMMRYDGDLLLPKRYLVEPPAIARTQGEFLAALGLTTLAVSETQKFGHVTYFWNGNRSGVLAPETEVYAEVPSDNVPFDQRPEMKANEITDLVQQALRRPVPPAIVRINYANGDMVGHTGHLAATVRAVECVDTQIGRLRALVEDLGGVLVVTADHGNADDMWLRDSKNRPILLESGLPQPKTSHTLAPVPFSILDARPTRAWRLREDQPNAGLANVAATVFHLLGYEAPADYEPAFVEPVPG